MNRALSQFFTPTWAAEIIVEQMYPHLNQDDLVIEPTCGDGRFLAAIPPDVPAYGVEIDPNMAEAARRNTGRTIITGDFAAVELPDLTPTLVLGNPPYTARFIDSLLERSHRLLRDGGEVGLLLPCYLFQTSSRVVRYSRQWSLRQTMVPRDMFQDLEKPLMFAQFTKDQQHIMVGLMLYRETDEIKQLAGEYRAMFIGNESRANVWGEAIERALAKLGGSGTLQQIYRLMEGKRPTANTRWKEQIRKVLQLHFEKLGPATYGMQRA